MGLLAWLLQAPCCPGGTGLAAAAQRGYWPGCSSPQYILGVLTWLAQAPGWPRGTGQAATGPRLALGYWLACCSAQGGIGLADTALRVQFLAKTETTISRGYSTWRKWLQLYPEGTVPGDNCHYYNQMIQYLAIMVTTISKVYST